VAEGLEGAFGFLAAQQPRQQHVVGNHGGKRHAGDDHHAGRRRSTADEGQQREPGMQLGQRQAEDERVRSDARRQQHLTGEGDRHDEHGGQHEVEREHPASQAEVARLDVFHYRDVELPRQADDRHHRHGGLNQHRCPVDVLAPEIGEFGRVVGAVEQVAEAVVKAEGDECADREKGQQLDQRFEGDRQDHAAVVLGDVEIARPEENGEQCQDDRDDQGRVSRAGSRGLDVDAAQHVHPEHDALELQRDVRQHTDQADQRDHHRQQLRLAVARGDEVGDGGDVFLLADHDHLLDHVRREQHEQDRTQIDRQERPQLLGGLADGTEEGPAGAVHRQREAVDPGPQARRHGGAVTVTIEGDGEQNGHIDEGDRGDQPA